MVVTPEGYELVHTIPMKSGPKDGVLHAKTNITNKIYDSSKTLSTWKILIS
jgi:hypothetical protein